MNAVMSSRLRSLTFNRKTLMRSDPADHAFDQRDTTIVKHNFNLLPHSVVRRSP